MLGIYRYIDHHMPEVKVIGEWSKELIWRPSQCYLDLEYDGTRYTIYLRWRHSDPWTCRVIREMDSKHEMWSRDELFEHAGVSPSQDDDVDSVCNNALELAIKYLKSGFYPD